MHREVQERPFRIIEHVKAHRGRYGLALLEDPIRGCAGLTVVVAEATTLPAAGGGGPLAAGLTVAVAEATTSLAAGGGGPLAAGVGATDTGKKLGATPRGR